MKRQRIEQWSELKIFWAKQKNFIYLALRQLQQSSSEIEVIIVDVTETEVEQPKKTEKLL